MSEKSRGPQQNLGPLGKSNPDIRPSGQCRHRHKYLQKIAQINRNLQTMRETKLKENVFQIIKSMINNKCYSGIGYNLSWASQILCKASKHYQLLARQGKLVLKFNFGACSVSVMAVVQCLQSNTVSAELGSY